MQILEHANTKIFDIGTYIFVCSCECPRNRVNTGPLCEAVRVNFENLQKPLTVSQSIALSLPLHISLEFISKDYRGTGGIFSLGDEVCSSILNYKLNPFSRVNSSIKGAFQIKNA